MHSADKTTLRRLMRERRRALPADDKEAFDAAICGRLLDVAKGHSPVAVYMASPEEVDLEECIRGLLARGTTVVSPRWNGVCYDLAKVEDLDAGSLRLGPMNIREPVAAEIVSPADIALWMVPGLAFSVDGHRLGYGGGWYDRFLAEASPSAPRLGVAYSFQVVDRLPVESHDIRLTGVVHEP